jgi:hypothetical protein
MRLLRLASLAHALALVAALTLVACGPRVTGGDDDPGGDADPGGCLEGVRRCIGTTLESCTGGRWTPAAECPGACDSQLGCVVCVPGTGTCTGDTSTACRADGQGYFEEYCDPVQGSRCGPGGICEGPCSAVALGESYIGCDYYPTQSSQLVNPSFQFAVAVSNAANDVANVTIEHGALTAPVTFTVAPGEVAVHRLPWVPALKRCQTEGFYECGAPQSYGALAVRGAYRLRATRPVTVYQFSPLDYAYGGKYSYSNDASLLLPTNAWTGNYVVPAWPAWNNMPSTMAITASLDGTAVLVTTRAPTVGGDGAPSFAAGVPQTVTLGAGDVLMLMSQTGDLTGSIVDADKPVQVIAGHHCTQVPIGSAACDHLEESVFPTEALSTEYLVTAPLLPSTGAPRIQMIRVTAAQAGTTVTLDPAVAGPFTLANVGDFAEIPRRAEDFLITGTRKIMVTHYMVGQNAAPAATTGDPAMTLAVPIEQYRDNYRFHAPTNYEANYVNVTAPTGAVVQVDGAAIPAGSYAPIGASGFGVARVALSNTGNGNHVAQSSVPFGITVYGYGQYTSYWYPGGLDLKPIVVE